MKFLVIRLGGISDILLTTPVIRCLSKQLPGSELHYLVATQHKHVIEHNPFISRIHVAGNNDQKLFDELKEESFEQVIDLQHDAFSARLKKHLKLPYHSFPKRSFQAAVFTRLKWNIMPANEHQVDRFMETVDSFGVKNDGAGLDYFIPSSERITQRDIPASHQLGYIAIVISASKFTRRMTQLKIRELCMAIDHPLILVGQEKDAELADAIASFDPVKVYNACGKFSFNETADLIDRSKLVIAPDTGFMQLAAALKKPLIVVWGSTTPSLGKTPYYGINHFQKNKTPSEHVQVHKLWCRPCTTEGRSSCPQGHFKCMKKISIEEITTLVKRKLSAKKEQG